jgi:hypothetical protein
MIFLIEYDRRRGRLVTFETYDNADRAVAERARVELELPRSKRGAPHEVVLLEAETEAALRLTHRRYFQSAREIIEAST